MVGRIPTRMGDGELGQCWWTMTSPWTIDEGRVPSPSTRDTTHRTTACSTRPHPACCWPGAPLLPSDGGHPWPWPSRRHSPFRHLKPTGPMASATDDI